MPRHFATLTAVVLMFASAALAQEQAAPRAPEQNTLVAYAVAVVTAIAIIAVSIISAKRTHRD